MSPPINILKKTKNYENCIFKNTFLFALALPAAADTSSVSIGDLFKKLTNTDADASNDNTLGINGFKSPNEVKQFMLNAGWQMKEGFSSGKLNVKESPAFDGFYTILSLDQAQGENAWHSLGMYFSKTDNYVLFTSDSQSGNKPKLFEISNQKLNPSSANYETFIKQRFLPKMRADSFVKISYNSIEPKAYVISASDCPYCVKLEKSLHKAKVNHFVIPVNSKNTDTSMKQARSDSIAMVCNGEKTWINKMVKNQPFTKLEPCAEKSNSDVARLEVDDLLQSINKGGGFPTVILVTQDDSAILRGYSDSDSKLINRNNLGLEVNLSERK